MTFNITKGYIFSFLLAVIAVILIGFGIKTRYDIAHDYALEELTLEDCQKGRYVSGTITEYVGYRIPGRQLPFSGISEHYSNGLLGAEYDIYTIKLKDGHYLSAYITDSDTLDTLLKYEHGHGKDASIHGKIIEMPIDLNYEWLMNSLGKNTRKEVDDIVSPTYAIVQVDFTKEKRKLDLGLFFLIIAAILFSRSGGFKNLAIKATVNMDEHETYQVPRYNLEFELERKNKKLQHLYRQYHAMKRNLLLSLPALPFGIYILVSTSKLTGRFLGISLLILFIRAVWKIFINSELAAAKSVAHTFSLNTLTRQITICEEEIEEIQENL